MKILITGSDGQLGTELQKQLFDRRSPLGAVPAEFGRATVVAVDVADLDITDEGAVSDFVTKTRPDTILNCAAFTNVDACEERPDVAERVNARAPGCIAAAAKAAGARFVHVSTDYVFSGDATSPRTEDDPTGPKTVYGRTKLAGEQAVFAAMPDAAVVRTAWLYGYNGKNFVKTILGAAKKKGAVRVVNDQFGNPTSAVDVAHHILKIAAGDLCGVFHCTNNGVCSWYDFAKTFVSLAGIDAEVTPCTTAEYPSQTPRPAYSALDNKRLRETVGDDMRPWQDAIAEYVRNIEADRF